jgi:uncharacterized protein YecE (DUF72 family)
MMQASAREHRGLAMLATLTTVIWIGTSGWAYKDWEGIVYPHPKPRGFDPLAYLARYFNTVEINTSYYGPPRQESAKKWVDSVQDNRNFHFTAKLYRAFTHERKATPEDERLVKDGLAPIVAANRFGALLLQFPWSFKNEPENREYLTGLHRRFREYPLVLEVRHASWNEPEILDLLAELDIGLCNVDQPLFKKSIEPGMEATSEVGYVRLHGRNYRNWFSKQANVRERYDYLYTPEELEPWADRIRQVSAKAKRTYAMSNNHNLGKAPANALELCSILTQTTVPAPPTLVERYPVLERYVRKEGW